MVAKRTVQKYRKHPLRPPRNSWPGEKRKKKEDIVPAVLDGAEPEKCNLGKSMILFMLLRWCGLGRHWLRLMASFIIPHCSIKFYSLHLQSK